MQVACYSNTTTIHYCEKQEDNVLLLLPNDTQRSSTQREEERHVSFTYL